MANSPLSRGTTLASLWAPITDVTDPCDLLAWPPDVFAIADSALDASETYRFVVSAPLRGQLTDVGGPAATRLAVEWWEWLDGARTGPPEPLIRWCKELRAAGALEIEAVAALTPGEPMDIVEALVGLHTVADEACAGLGSSTSGPPGPGCTFRAAARELMAETGSLSRAPRAVLRVLPRCRSSAGGISIRSLSRHVFVTGPQVDVTWNRVLSQPTGVRPPEAHANGVILPWPLRIRSRDFTSLPLTLPSMKPAETGFFTYEPSEALDLDMVDGVLRAAIDEAGVVDFVFLPEEAITPDDIEPLEAVLAAHGVWCVVAGVGVPAKGDQLGKNYVHVGLRQGQMWRHASQHKHHRWRLDGRQISQYHLGGALMPTMHWWEAVCVPRRSLQVIDEGAITFIPLVCEDLARHQPVADLVRSIGPSLVVALLLDGPQLGSRWTARYASVLADDPGSAVCTVTSYGMVRRCRPPGCRPSRVVALWKDASGELTEIELEDGADAVLISTNVTVASSSTADGRRHAGSTNTLKLCAVQSLRADGTAASAPPPELRPVAPDASPPALPPLDEHEASKAASWAEALAEAVLAGPEYVDRVLHDASAREWRAELGLPPPSQLFEQAIDALRRELPLPATLEALIDAAGRLRLSDDPVAATTGTLLQIAIEARLLSEVSTGRMPPNALRSLGASTHSTDEAHDKGG